MLSSARPRRLSLLLLVALCAALCVSRPPPARAEFAYDDPDVQDALFDRSTGLCTHEPTCGHKVAQNKTEPAHTMRHLGCPMPESHEYNFDECCETHDTCYETCGKSKMQCDARLWRCMRAQCENASRKARDVQIETECVAEGRVMYNHAAHDLGCKDFLMAQNAACECPHDEL